MAAVATRHTAGNPPHMTSSPRSKRSTLQSDSKKDGAADAKSVPAIKRPDEDAAASRPSDSTTDNTNAPLAPPPKPNQNGDAEYSSSHFSKEPNPFENAFGNPAETPGKTQLPGVTSLTSPASLLPGNTPGWPGSLRSGPLSPAMLTGPTGTSDYFSGDHHFTGNFPTPNESSLRSGLTPGGGGSMFPQPSPNSQAIFNSMQQGGATPGTLDFHRTAMTARAQSSVNTNSTWNHVPTSQATSNPNIQPDLDSKSYMSNSHNQQDAQDPFGSHQTNDAANGLFMLAQAGGQRGQQQNYSLPQPQQQQQQAAPQPPSFADKRANKGSVGSVASASTDQGEGQFSDEDTKPQIKNGRGKKGSAAKATPASKRKTEETPAKAGNKKARGSNGMPVMSPEPEDEDMLDDDDMMNGDKKMTDEEKRKNFLERNRVAALKCRQRKKQWLANLQSKVEIFSTENDALAATVTQLREEIVGLKTLLLAHKDCPVSQAQGISGMAMQQIAGDAQGYPNPYGMSMPHGQMPQGQMQRR